METEIKLSAFVAEHNISFMAMDHLSEVLKSCFPDSRIAAEIAIKRKKCTLTVKNVIGEFQKDYLENIIKSHKFSILVDESNDISATKTMCIIIRYFDEQQNKVMSSLWELAPLYEAGDFTMPAEATAEAMFDLIIKKFTDRGIPLENIIGFASDGCNVMMGSQNSVASRMRENLPGIFIFKCICHSMHLCASEACKKLPRRCEDLARNIYGFFKLSSKRQAQSLKFQVFTTTKIHKILHPSHILGGFPCYRL